MTRFLVRCVSVAISTSVLAVGAGRADARDSNEGRDAESKNMKLVGFSDLQARSTYQPTLHKQGGRYFIYAGHHALAAQTQQPCSGKTLTARERAVLKLITEGNEPRWEEAS